MPLKARSSKLNSKRNGNGPALSRKRKVIESPSDSDSEHDENWPVSTKRALRKKTKAVSYKEPSNGAASDDDDGEESEYQMDDDLEIDEFDDDDDGDSEYEP